MKKMPKLYVNEYDLTFDFTCNKNLFESKFLSEEDITLQYTLLKDGLVSVLIWKGDPRTLIIEQKVPYIEGQRYEIYYKFGYSTNPIHFESYTQHYVYPKCTYVGPKSSNEVVFYECKKFMHPKEAKKEWKYLKKNGLVTRAYWDYEMDYYDWKCLGCKEAWVGNPEIGRVRYFFNDPDRFRAFKYHGSYFTRVYDWENHMLSFYNKQEWEAKVKELGYDGRYKSFDEMWGLPSVKGTWADINKSNEEQGHWWREKNDHYKLIDDDTFEELELTGEGLEKVVTPGWHQGIPKNSIECPVCNALYQIMNSGWTPLTLMQKIKMKHHWASEARLLKKQKKNRE